jgi:RHS repeat-associated protein
LFKNFFQKQFTYNSVGAISSTLDSVYGASPVLFDKFHYNNFNRLRQYIQYDTAGADYSACESSRQNDHWDWRYNYSPTSGMESKKLFFSPTSNNCNTHAFNYYLQGANGEMFVEFNGKQWAKDTLEHTGNRVYYYAKAYNLPGTNFRFKLNENDSSKFDFYDWFIQDHNGTTKLIVNKHSNPINPQKKFLNYPFGDTLKTAIVGNFKSDLNAFGEIQNHEMPYSIMGFRIYSEELGRFLSPDPLLELFNSWTPYQFAFNNPVMYSDPTGLAPQKEKREAKYIC